VEPIAFAGDSYVFGNEVNAEDTFVHLIENAILRPTVNLGIGGYSLSQSSLALRLALAQSPPIAAGFLVIYVGNDLEFGAFPPETRGVDPEGFLRDEGPLRWHLVRLRGHALRYSRLFFTINNAWRVLRAEAPADGQPVPTEVGHRWIYSEDAAVERLEDHRRVLTMLRDEAAARNTTVTVVIMPEKDQVYGSLSDRPNLMLHAILSDLGFPFVDLLPLMRERASRGPSLWQDGLTDTSPRKDTDSWRRSWPITFEPADRLA
jgi:hypothetical protein